MSKEMAFWKWFEDNCSRLYNSDENSTETINDIIRALKRVRKGLCFEMSTEFEGRREFIISADGDDKLFPSVIRLAESAPAFDKWTVIPFRQPKGLNFVLRVNGLSLAPDDVWFKEELDKHLVHLEFYIRGLDEKSKEAYPIATLLMLDTVLGEYMVGTKLGDVDFFPLPEDPEKQGLKPLRSIMSVFPKDAPPLAPVPLEAVGSV